MPAKLVVAPILMRSGPVPIRPTQFRRGHDPNAENGMFSGHERQDASEPGRRKRLAAVTSRVQSGEGGYGGLFYANSGSLTGRDNAIAAAADEARLRHSASLAPTPAPVCSQQGYTQVVGPKAGCTRRCARRCF